MPQEPDTTIETAAAIPRDIRVDQIGFVAELQKLYADHLKTLVKDRMGRESIARVEGDFYEGLLISGGSVSVADPAKFLRLYESKRITRKEFLSALAVRNEPAKQFLSLDELDAISERQPASPALRVSKKKQVEVKLVDAVKSIQQTMNDER
jgi:hypothetical protein